MKLHGRVRRDDFPTSLAATRAHCFNWPIKITVADDHALSFTAAFAPLSLSAERRATLSSSAEGDYKISFDKQIAAISCFERFAH